MDDEEEDVEFYVRVRGSFFRLASGEVFCREFIGEFREG